MDISLGAKYQHAKGGIYTVLGFCKMKNDQTRSWEEAVIYVSHPAEKLKGDLYVRSKADFTQRFTEVRAESNPT
jgi:hypothetical protein